MLSLLLLTYFILCQCCNFDHHHHHLILTLKRIFLTDDATKYRDIPSSGYYAQYRYNYYPGAFLQWSDSLLTTV